jgi:hypothetical protein
MKKEEKRRKGVPFFRSLLLPAEAPPEGLTPVATPAAPARELY